ncbi:MAG: universal stress protein [Nitrospirae bacterium]|nr:universal stress protein [Nitrospirota bacterium]
MFKKILVPLDGSELCETALNSAEIFAKQFDAELILLHVVPHVTLYTETEGRCVDVCEPDEKARSVAGKYLFKRANELELKGIKTSWVIRTGEYPAKEIINYAKENAVSLIVMSTHGRSRFSHLLLGSVAEKVAREGSQYSSVFLVRCGKSC